MRRTRIPQIELPCWALLCAIAITADLETPGLTLGSEEDTKVAVPSSITTKEGHLQVLQTVAGRRAAKFIHLQKSTQTKTLTSTIHLLFLVLQDLAPSMM